VKSNLAMTGKSLRVLVADDEDTFRRVLSRELVAMGFCAEEASSGSEVLRRVRDEDFDVLLLDVKMPGMDGITVLKTVRKQSPFTEVIMLTAYGTIDSAISAIRLGAYDYLTKPCKLEELEAVITKAGERRSLEQRNVILRQELARRDGVHELIGESPGLQRVLKLIGKVAQSDSTVLIQGESGVGKELAARGIHRESPRRDNPFVVVDCTSLQEDLLQTELFGHEKGAFTGAVALKHGLFEVADTGTVFLDEVGELSPGIQAKLLRVIETNIFRRVGGVKDIHVNVRLIAATNQDIKELAAQGRFRQDLYYRLSVFTMTIPPLRERPEDIRLLARHFTATGQGAGRTRKRLAPEVMRLLQAYHWPGNVRELRNVIERGLILAEGDCIRVDDLPGNIQTGSAFPPHALDTTPTLEQVEKIYVARLLQENDGNRAKVARMLGISERNLYRKIRRYEL
jgi:two-component system, NtrC family, response regulator AtoC